jgi:hypothetical protein
VLNTGKDRTGLICALVLACCGVSEEEIVQNYQESEKYLSPVMDRIQEENALKGLDSSFDGTPREVMQVRASIYRVCARVQVWSSLMCFAFTFSLARKRWHSSTTSGAPSPSTWTISVSVAKNKDDSPPYSLLTKPR